ncbi:MAG: peptidoglycan DD-metalloendopeptidase family protein, partial [Gammaproteobacteria bacterium]|nr:peptidoglycan DD-metalloendopeptidase family protein [Gammaproteobacteria bacterium]
GRLSGNQNALKQQVRAAYISGQEAYLKLILSQRDPQRLGRMLIYYDYLNHARLEEIDGLQTTLQKLESLNKRKQETQKELKNLLQRKETDKQAMEVSQKQRQLLLAQLAIKLEDKEVELAQLKEDEQRLHTLLNDLTEALSDIPAVPKQLQAFASLKGTLAWPVSGKLEASYGTRRSRGLRWKGVVLDASKDNQVKVVSHGRIAFSDWLRGYGLLSIVDHGNGYMSLYGQNHSLYKKVGDWVEKGEIIAEAGENGSEQAQLYFEIRHRGKPVNPQRWCRR